jgi:kynurenine 3-monooxygenase
MASPPLNKHTIESTHFIVLGAGPVGLQAALVLSQQGHRVTVYDKVGDTTTLNSLEDTYPIGVNRRGLLSLSQTGTADQVEATGILVDSWQIFASGGGRRVACLPSGNVYGQTRAQVTNILLQRAQQDPNIDIQWNHALESIDFRSKMLTFVDTKRNARIIVQASDSTSRVLAADGVWSVARAEMERAFGAAAAAAAATSDSTLCADYGFNDHVGKFTSKVTPWAVRFRVLFSTQPGNCCAELDPAVHYVFSGIYTAIINPGDKSGQNDHRWCIVLSVMENEEDTADRDLLLSQDASNENVVKLRSYIERKAPALLPLFSEADAKAFFRRRTFHGALVAVNRLCAGEWLCLLGDAAHSAIPPTGEGINSGLEDCQILAQGLNHDGSVPTDFFAKFNQARLEHVLCLHEIAIFLNDNFYANNAEKAARIMAQIVSSIRHSICLGPPSYQELTFGRKSNPPVSYKEVARVFQSNYSGLSTMRILVRPFAGVASISPPKDKVV